MQFSLFISTLCTHKYSDNENRQTGQVRHHLQDADSRQRNHRYASTQPFTIGEDGKKRYSHKHWGTLDENLRFHPNTTYLYASIEERSKLIFPKEWDLSELENLESNRKRGRVAYEADDADRMYGAT